jgi:hypothetical protein
MVESEARQSKLDATRGDRIVEQFRGANQAGSVIMKQTFWSVTRNRVNRPEFRKRPTRITVLTRRISLEQGRPGSNTQK